MHENRTYRGFLGIGLAVIAGAVMSGCASGGNSGLFGVGNPFSRLKFVGGVPRGQTEPEIVYADSEPESNDETNDED